MAHSALITVPCYNEEAILQDNVVRLLGYCRDHLAAYRWTIVIADNSSSDNTPAIGRDLARTHREIEYFHLPEKGRGNILRACWGHFDADIYAYMDADLATRLEHLPELLNAVSSGADLVIGSRLIPGATVEGRSLGRELTSRGYNWIVRHLFDIRIHDAQCGFKAISRRLRDGILPITRDGHWFFDSETLIIAQHRRLAVREIPIRWDERQAGKSKVRLASDIVYFLRRIAAMKHRLRTDPALRDGDGS